MSIFIANVTSILKKNGVNVATLSNGVVYAFKDNIEFFAQPTEEGFKNLCSFAGKAWEVDDLDLSVLGYSPSVTLDPEVSHALAVANETMRIQNQIIVAKQTIQAMDMNSQVANAIIIRERNRVEKLNQRKENNNSSLTIGQKLALGVGITGCVLAMKAVGV